MSGFLGRNLRILKDGVVIAAVQTKSLSRRNEYIDVSGEETDGFRHFLDTVDTREVSISVEGVMRPEHWHQLIVPRISGAFIDVEVEFPDGSTLRSDDGAILTALSFQSETRTAVKFSASLVLSGPWVTADPLPTTWTGGAWPGSFFARDAAYGDGLFVVVGHATNFGATGVITSPDAETWTFRTIPVSPFCHMRAVAYHDGRFVAAGNELTNYGHYVIYSDDGITWTRATRNTALDGYMPGGIAYGNGYFAVGTSLGRVAYSADNGVTWAVTGNISAPQNYQFAFMEFIEGSFITGGGSDGGNARIYSSADPATWGVAQITTGWVGGLANNTFDPHALGGYGTQILIAGRWLEWAVNETTDLETGYVAQPNWVLNDYIAPPGSGPDFARRIGSAFNRAVAVGIRSVPPNYNTGTGFVAFSLDGASWAEADWGWDGSTASDFTCFAAAPDRLLVAGSRYALWF